MPTEVQVFSFTTRERERDGAEIPEGWRPLSAVLEDGGILRVIATHTYSHEADKLLR